jgi:hypothetical protein
MSRGAKTKPENPIEEKTALAFLATNPMPDSLPSVYIGPYVV